MFALLVFAWVSADQVGGIVVDPHQRPIAGAVVEITCADLAIATDSNERGVFEIDVRATGACELSVSHPGFETETRSVVVPASSPLTFELSPANWEERVEVLERRVTPAKLATAGMGGASVTADVMRVAGPDSARWLTLAQRAAGQPLGTYALTVNGMPSSLLPPSDAISAISTAPDPFSAEAAGADRVMIDVTSEPPREWQLSLSPGALANQQQDVLLPEASSRSQHRAFAAGGPLVTQGAVRAFLSASHSFATGQPTYLEHVDGGDRLTSSVESSTDSRLWTGDVYGRRGAWEVSGSVSASRSAITNGGIGGRSGPPGALEILSTVRRDQLIWRRSGRSVLLRGGISVERERRDVKSPVTGPGYVFADRLIAGAPDTLAFSQRSSATSVRAIAASRGGPVQGWMAGFEAGTKVIRERRLFNAAGVIVVTAPHELTGARFVRPVDVAAHVSTPHVAGFAQRVIASTDRIWARIGARAEWQREFGVIVSPRAAVGFQAGRYLIGANIGTFSDFWMAPDHIEASFRTAAPIIVQSGTITLPVLFHGNGARRTDMVTRVSAIRPFRIGSIGVEEIIRLGGHLSGLTRRLAADHLIDVLDDSRSLLRRQMRLRIDVAHAAWSAAGFYEHAYARDDTGGTFSLPASGSNLAAERGPAVGVPAHALTGMLAGSVRGVRVLASVRASSGTPYSLLTGLDPEGLFTFTGRVGESRNLQRSPPSSDVSTYLARQFRLPVAKFNVDVGVRFENLFGAVTPLDIERSAASSLAGRPITAARGRSISAWATLGRR